MENTVLIRTYAADDPALRENTRELWRYAGYAGIPEDPVLLEAAEDVRQTIRPQLTFRVCWRRLPVQTEAGRLLSPLRTESQGLMKLLSGCTEAVMMAATVGIGADRCIARWGRTSPLRALLAQAYGAERIEALCDAFCRDFSAQLCEGLSCTPRFSPGYGDLPLETQHQFFTLLDCSRRIGLSLNESLLMSPSKSVTAVFGIRTGAPSDSEVHRCGACAKTDCAFRREA